MASETITFLCPACTIKLTVPGNLAGVTGPCPSCGTLIQAPHAAPAPAPQPVPAYQQSVPQPPAYQQPAYQQPVQDYPAYHPPVQAPQIHQPPVAAPPVTTPIPVAATPVYQTPPPIVVVPLEETQPISAPPPVVLRPEPRQLPTRTTQGEPAAKPMPEPSYSGSSGKGSLPRHPHHRNRFARFLMLFLFLLASGGIVFGVLTVLKNQTKQTKVLESAPFRPILPPDSVPAKPAETAAPALPVPLPEQPLIVEPPPSLPEGIEAKSPNQAAREVLDQFLAAKSVAERIPWMESQTPVADLAKTCLAGPLPAVVNVSIDAIENVAIEQVTDFYHNVDFDAGDNRTNPQTILVRIRGSAEPRVVVDPFLDSYGGRLAAYAQTPTDKAGTFQVIISPLAACYDERVPNREKKLTLKLLARDNTKEIAQAYFGRQSKIAQMLEDGTYSLSYGKAKACTVVLRWNVEDRPETPYLEAINLKTLDWNP